jgi:glycosyltransferase involved in cell wall biosynthesis
MMNKRLLLVAYHFPPVQGSTGVTRTLAFARYLREFDWDVTVLTVHPRAYTSERPENLALIPDYVQVERAWALDARRHIALRGRYPLALAIPDRWQSWIAGGLWRARRIVRRWHPHAVLSTYPIASAHCIGYGVHRMFGLPWIADFRDPMAQDGYPPQPLIHRAFQAIEHRVFKRAARVVVTTPGAEQLYAARFPSYPRPAINVISNGFDPGMFPDGPTTARADRGARQPLQVLHSGLLYTDERNPEALFAALAALRGEGHLADGEVEFRFRASGNDEHYARLIGSLGLDRCVQFLPPIPYRDALQEMRGADALLLMQASNCNQQIPAKLYEYLYAQRPILALADPVGDTAALLRDLGAPRIAPLDDRDAIRALLRPFLADLREGRADVVPRARIMPFSRRELTRSLASLLDEVIHETAGQPVGA